MQAVLITRGSRGMALFEPKQRTIHVPIVGSDEVADVTGAGDTVIATFGLALAAGASFYEAARLANYAGGLVVMKRGTATVSARELADAVTATTHDARELVAGRAGAGTKISRQGQQLGLGLGKKLMGSSDEEDLIAAVARDRAAGRTIAFANGCFDLLHVGHVRYLQGAAAEADRLIVAVNDDRSVAALKGASRPILPAADRAELVAALRGVDYVVLFGDPTVERLLRPLRPDVHCKGTDYTVDTVPERAVVEAYGGRTAIVGDPKNHATRDLLANRDRRRSRLTPNANVDRVEAIATVLTRF